MATITFGDKKVEVKDGDPIADACEELGVPFACKDGVCGTCKIQIKEGTENLSELNDKEQAMGDRDTNNRLACQCRIKSGNVIIDF